MQQESIAKIVIYTGAPDAYAAALAAERLASSAVFLALGIAMEAISLKEKAGTSEWDESKSAAKTAKCE